MLCNQEVFRFNASPLNKMGANSQTTFSNEFSWMKIIEFRFKFHKNLVLRDQLILNQHLSCKLLVTEHATSHYLNQGWPRSPMHVCVDELIEIRKWCQFTTHTPRKQRSYIKSVLSQFYRCSCFGSMKSHFIGITKGVSLVANVLHNSCPVILFNPKIPKSNFHMEL